MKFVSARPVSSANPADTATPRMPAKDIVTDCRCTSRSTTKTSPTTTGITTLGTSSFVIV